MKRARVTATYTPTPWFLLALGLAAVAILLLLLPTPSRGADDGVAIPVDCGQTVCVMPKRIWEAVMEGHNATVDENRALKAELERLKGAAPAKPAPPCVMPRGVSA